MKKSFETKMTVDGKELPLNNFVQETIGNIMDGFSKSLKGLDAGPQSLRQKHNGCQHQLMLTRSFTLN
jgi:hypothetical protein